MLTLPALSLPMAAVTASVPPATLAFSLAVPSEPLAIVPALFALALGAGLLLARHALQRGGSIGDRRRPISVPNGALPAKA
jgi:hypothetical protein